MAPATTGGSSSVPSLPPPCPKSPPEYPDLYGKRREMAKVQMLEREIGFLEVGFKFAIILCSPPNWHVELLFSLLYNEIILNWQFQFEQEELKSLHGLQPASRCCKEVTDFVVANSDPLIPTGDAAAAVLFLDPIAVERSHATGTAAAALVNCLHAQIAHVAGGHALVPNAQSQRFVVCLLKLAAMCQGICSLFTSNTALVQELVNL
ncbi:hypothetical protein POTOM_023392 [Populus tomentosa]|uniref:Uncharacterized protein n=1 Tax=Populus tomentosa TaxID=118781 RepID=A0A8X8CZF4_POPTO|nr:hypothetical protein POTOM_023392 [Populus tomentosa]